MKSPYEILGVEKSASPEEIKSAYRKLAKKLHPDRHPDDPTVGDKFKEVSAAYDILKDPKKKAEHDYKSASPFRGGPTPFGAGFFFGRKKNFSFESARPKRGNNITTTLVLSIGEGILGTSRKVEYSYYGLCPSCKGEGALEFSTCPHCKGDGMYSYRQGNLFVNSIDPGGFSEYITEMKK